MKRAVAGALVAAVAVFSVWLIGGLVGSGSSAEPRRPDAAAERRDPQSSGVQTRPRPQLRQEAPGERAEPRVPAGEEVRYQLSAPERREGESEPAYAMRRQWLEWYAEFRERAALSPAQEERVLAAFGATQEMYEILQTNVDEAQTREFIAKTMMDDYGVSQEDLGLEPVEPVPEGIMKEGIAFLRRSLRLSLSKILDAQQVRRLPVGLRSAMYLGAAQPLDRASPFAN